MKKENEKETIEFTEDELYEAAVYARTNGLLNILTEDLEEDAHLTLGSNGFPAIDAIIGDLNCRISYFPMGDTDTDRFPKGQGQKPATFCRHDSSGLQNKDIAGGWGTGQYHCQYKFRRFSRQNKQTIRRKKSQGTETRGLLCFFGMLRQ